MRALLLALLVVVPMSGCSDESARADAHNVVADTLRPAALAPAAPVWLDSARRAEEQTIYLDAARRAWRFVDRNYIARTGLTRPFDTYATATMWDIASGLAALYSAHGLGLVDSTTYESRMRRALSTIARMPLYRDVGYNKEYVTETAAMIGVERRPSSKGYGMSATDHGRFLTWLRIISETEPRFAPVVDSIIRRIDFDSFIDDDYLQGTQVSRTSGRERSFQEGRIGYEQYAATGFALWGHVAEKALDINENARNVEVSSVSLPADRRGGDRLTSEPFVLLGLEVGWTPAQKAVADRLLAAQQARWKQTGKVTIVSEDAINIAPDYFFYFTAYSRRGPWSVDVQRRAKVEGPRWVSTKATFAWHALVPGDYTRQALDLILDHAAVGDVWGSGVFESGRPTGNPNINTAAVVLEAALYRLRGAPLLKAG